MASNEFHFRCLVPSIGTPITGESWGVITDGEVAPTLGIGEIIEPNMVSAPVMGDPGDPGTDTTRYFWDQTNASISGYRRLRTTSTGIRTTKIVTFEDDPPELQEVLVDEFATSSGDMDGVSVNGSTMTWRIHCKALNTPGGASSALLRLYHRTTGGTETLLQEVNTGPLSNAFEDHDLEFSFTQAWDTGEFLVAKVYALSGLEV